jgi:type IV fimbrial biogenesis protein FimT
VLRARSAQRGFNLIEVLVVVAVLGVSIAIGAPAFGEWLQNQQIRAASDAMTNGFQLARAEAIRRNLPVRIAVGPGSAWAVAEAASGTAIQARSAEEGSPNAIVITDPVAATMVTFSPLGGVAANADGSPRINSLDVVNPGGGACATAAGPMRCLRVVITAGGSVRMCDPALASPDPRAC